ncbi:SIS domain-containing protein [Streptomyces sp. NPDC004561]
MKPAVRPEGQREPAPADPLARPAVEQADPRRMIDDVVAQPAHLRDALDLLREVELPRGDFPGGLVVCGVGGSGLAGDVTSAVLGPRARRPVHTVRDYRPWPWLDGNTLVLCPSYSGNTDITLEYFTAAREAGAAVVALTGGGRLAELAAGRGTPLVRVPAGYQPRAVTSYAIVTALACAAAAGAGPDLREEIADAADFLQELVEEWGPQSPPDSLAKKLARDLTGTTALVYGTGPTAAVAHRWKTQLNETGKQAAFASEVLEADHHELCVWDHLDPARWSAVFLADPADQHPRALHRLELTAQLVAGTGAAAHWIPARGATRIQRVLSLVLLADFVSVYAAALSGVDPSDIPLISRLNRLVGGYRPGPGEQARQPQKAGQE